MKKTDYQKALDKIKCSESFRSQLSVKLSKEPETSEEYADIITDVEMAKPQKIGYSAAAIAACAAICVGIATVYKNASDSPNTYDSNISASEVEVRPVDTAPDMNTVLDELYGLEITANLGFFSHTYTCGDDYSSDLYEYVDDSSTYKNLSPLTAKTVLDYLSYEEWDKWILEDDELTDEIKDQICSEYVRFGCDNYEIYIYESSYVELRINDSADAQTSVFYDFPDNWEIYEIYIELYNGSSPPLDNFYHADIAVNYEGGTLTLTEEQKNQIRAILTKYDWVPSNASVGSMTPLGIQLTVGDKTSYLNLNGTVEYYEDGYDMFAEEYQPPTLKYIQTLEIKEQIKEIIEPSCNPIAMKSLPDCEMKIRYGSGDYITVSTEENKEKLIRALYNVTWEPTDSQQLMVDIDNSLILQLIENGEESYFFLNNNIEYRMGDIAQSYILPDNFRNTVLGVYCSEISEPVFINISERAPTYLGEELTEAQTLKLQELLGKCNWSDTVVTDKSDITLNHDTAVTLKLGSGPIYLQFFDNGYVRCFSPEAAISDSLFKQTEFTTSEAKEIITADFDYSAAAIGQINLLPISPFLSVYYEDTQLLFITNDSQYESDSTVIAIDLTQGIELWTILSEAEYEYAENTDFEYENFYQLSFTDHQYRNPITFNEDGYVYFSTDDHNYIRFTVRMSESDTEALNSFLQTLKEN